MKKPRDMTLPQFRKAIAAIGFRRVMWAVENIATGKSTGYAYDRGGVISLRKTLAKLKKFHESQARCNMQNRERAERDARLAATEKLWKAGFASRQD